MPFPGMLHICLVIYSLLATITPASIMYHPAPLSIGYTWCMLLPACLCSLIFGATVPISFKIVLLL